MAALAWSMPCSRSSSTCVQPEPRERIGFTGFTRPADSAATPAAFTGTGVVALAGVIGFFTYGRPVSRKGAWAGGLLFGLLSLILLRPSAREAAPCRCSTRR